MSERYVETRPGIHYPVDYATLEMAEEACRRAREQGFSDLAKVEIRHNPDFLLEHIVITEDRQ